MVSIYVFMFVTISALVFIIFMQSTSLYILSSAMNCGWDGGLAVSSIDHEQEVWDLVGLSFVLWWVNLLSRVPFFTKEYNNEWVPTKFQGKSSNFWGNSALVKRNAYTLLDSLSYEK